MSARLRLMAYRAPGALCPFTTGELAAMLARLELVDRLPLALSIAQHGGGGGLLALQRALALEGIALTGDPTTWPAQVETIQATEHARAMRDIDAAEQRARLDVS